MPKLRIIWAKIYFSQKLNIILNNAQQFFGIKYIFLVKWLGSPSFTQWLRVQIQQIYCIISHCTVIYLPIFFNYPSRKQVESKISITKSFSLTEMLNFFKKQSSNFDFILVETKWKINTKFILLFSRFLLCSESKYYVLLNFDMK